MVVCELFKEYVNESEVRVHSFSKPNNQPVVAYDDISKYSEVYTLPPIPPRFLKKIEFLARVHQIPLHFDRKTKEWFVTKLNKAFSNDVEYVLSAAGRGALGLAETPTDQFLSNRLHNLHYEVIDPTKDETDQSRRHFATNDLKLAQRIAQKLGFKVIQVSRPKTAISSYTLTSEAKGTKVSAAEKKLNPGVDLNTLVGRYVWIIVPGYNHIAKAAKVIRIGDTGLVHVKLNHPLSNHAAVPGYFKGQDKIAVTPNEIYIDLTENSYTRPTSNNPLKEL